MIQCLETLDAILFSIVLRDVAYLYDSFSLDQFEGIFRERCTIQEKWIRSNERWTKLNTDGVFEIELEFEDDTKRG